MLLHIPQVLTTAEAEHCCQQLLAAAWASGQSTAGQQGARVKNNRQLPEDSALARELGDTILARLERHPMFISAALPAQVYPPMFNRYEGGEQFGHHIDNAVRLLPGSGIKIRTDVSATLFLAEPDSYDGGELVIQDTYGQQQVKLPAGDLLIYPATSLHRVAAVTRGIRLASFFWIQSMVRETAQRSILFEMDTAIQRLNRTGADGEALVHLTGSYHNLLRMWGDV